MHMPHVWARLGRWLTAGLLVSSLALADGAPRIGLLLKGRSTFWSAVEAGARRVADEAGAELVVKAPVTENDITI